MNKYINVDELRTEFWTPDDKEYSYKDICKILDEMPSADVVEVKHGEWKTDFGIAFTCSVCNRMISKPCDFCPNCGAYMRERKETE